MCKKIIIFVLAIDSKLFLSLNACAKPLFFEREKSIVFTKNRDRRCERCENKQYVFVKYSGPQKLRTHEFECSTQGPC